MPGPLARMLRLPAAPGAPWCIGLGYMAASLAVVSFPTLWFWMGDAAAARHRRRRGGGTAAPQAGVVSEDVMQRGKGVECGSGGAGQEEDQVAWLADVVGNLPEGQWLQEEGRGPGGTDAVGDGGPSGMLHAGGMDGRTAAAGVGEAGSGGEAPGGVRLVLSARLQPLPAAQHQDVSGRDQRRQLVAPALQRRAVAGHDQYITGGAQQRGLPSSRDRSPPSRRYTMSVKVMIGLRAVLWGCRGRAHSGGKHRRGPPSPLPLQWQACCCRAGTRLNVRRCCHVSRVPWHSCCPCAHWLHCSG